MSKYRETDYLEQAQEFFGKEYYGKLLLVEDSKMEPDEEKRIQILNEIYDRLSNFMLKKGKRDNNLTIA